MEQAATAISHRLMYFFGPAARFAAAFLGLAGFAVLLWGEWAGGILLIFGLTMVSAQSGMDIYPGDYKYRLHYKILWLFKFGKSKDLTPFNRLMVRPWRGTHVVYSRSNRRVEEPERKWVVYALHQGGKEKIPLFIAREQESALQKAEEFKSAIHLNWID